MADGKVPSWEEVARDHGRFLYTVAFRLTGNDDDAQDLVQEVLLPGRGRAVRRGRPALPGDRRRPQGARGDGPQPHPPGPGHAPGGPGVTADVPDVPADVPAGGAPDGTTAPEHPGDSLSALLDGEL